LYIHILKTAVLDITPVKNKFVELFDQPCKLYSSPGRINLIGEHTDYNEGFVLPAAIDKEAVFAIALNNNQKFRFFALDLDEYYEAENIEIATKEFQWANYLLGVLAQFEKEGINVNGIDCVFGSNIPVGAGLSSSAAIECGFAYGVNDLLKTGFADHKLVLMAQKAEHEYTGVMCGVMDQFASVFGRANHVILLDCRDYSHQYFPFKIKDYSIVLCDTNVKHSLASSEYNVRRRECEEGVEILKKYNPDISALRDVTSGFLQSHESDLPPVVSNRCKYVVEENERVNLACKLLSASDMKDFGKLMYQSHEGLKDQYEVSCRELDILVEATLTMDYVLGARMMGGGFGGCTINLVKTTELETFKKRIASQYYEQLQRDITFYDVNIGDGTKSIS
jgi:galactokinase